MERVEGARRGVQNKRGAPKVRAGRNYRPPPPLSLICAERLDGPVALPEPAALEGGLHQPRLPAVPYRVKEVTAQTVLQRCRHPHIPWSLNPYQGCAHACRFCYVPSLLHIDRATWGEFVSVKRNAPAVLAREVRTHPRALVAVSTATDPYQALEARCLVTRRCLEVLAGAQWPVSVLSRSPLMLRDVDVFHRFRELQVGMSLPTLDDEARRWMEPGAPSVEARLRCLRALAEEGFPTFVSLAPLYPLTNGVTAARFAGALAEARVSEAFVGGYRHYGDSWDHMLPRILASGIEGLGRFADRAYIHEVALDLVRELRARGVEAR